jgi:predicted CopG family antitoxin
MKNIMIREDVYDKLKDIKGETSFSDFEKIIMEVHRVAKGRLF